MSAPMVPTSIPYQNPEHAGQEKSLSQKLSGVRRPWNHEVASAQ